LLGGAMLIATKTPITKATNAIRPVCNLLIPKTAHNGQLEALQTVPSDE
jgi:hypothetical protein